MGRCVGVAPSVLFTALRVRGRTSAATVFPAPDAAGLVVLQPVPESVVQKVDRFPVRPGVHAGPNESAVDVEVGLGGHRPFDGGIRVVGDADLRVQRGASVCCRTVWIRSCA